MPKEENKQNNRVETLEKSDFQLISRKYFNFVFSYLKTTSLILPIILGEPEEFTAIYENSGNIDLSGQLPAKLTKSLLNALILKQSLLLDMSAERELHQPKPIQMMTGIYQVLLCFYPKLWWL